MSLALDILSGVCLITGAVMMIISALGMIRLPDLFTRLHGASICRYRRRIPVAVRHGPAG